MIQVPLIKELICYICGRGVTEKDSVRIGGGLRRHRKCKPVAKRRKERPSKTAPVNVIDQEIPVQGRKDELFP